MNGDLFKVCCRIPSYKTQLKGYVRRLRFQGAAASNVGDRIATILCFIKAG